MTRAGVAPNSSTLVQLSYHRKYSLTLAGLIVVLLAVCQRAFKKFTSSSYTTITKNKIFLESRVEFAQTQRRIQSRVDLGDVIFPTPYDWDLLRVVCTTTLVDKEADYVVNIDDNVDSCLIWPTQSGRLRGAALTDLNIQCCLNTNVLEWAGLNLFFC